MYLDDGTGLIDLGTDNVYDFDEEGNMIGISDGTWLSIDGNAVAYYYESTVEGADGKGNVGEDCYMITGYVPVVYNGRLAKLIVVFDSDTPYGYIAGVRFDYNSDENNYVVSKTLGSFLGASAENALYTFDSTLGTFGDFGELVDLDAEQSIAALQVGDKIQFVADYYDYDGNYLDSYVIGNWTVTKNPEIANMKPGMGTPLAMYSFTDIYNQTYWTAVME